MASSGKRWRSDWRCRCGEKVFGSKDRCFKCHSRRPSSPPRSPPSKRVDRGDRDTSKDWTCAQCHFVVWGGKPCRKCGARPPGSVGEVAAASSSASVAVAWRCMQCGFDNSKGDHCEMCRTKRGYWRCGTCEFDVFANKRACFKCGTKRPIDGERAVAADASSVLGSAAVVAWKCPNCDAGQPEANKFCAACGSTRAGEGGSERCVVCMDGPQDTLLKHDGGQGHKCVCMACANVLYDAGDACPMCRGVILEVIRAFDG
jgi:hypothetical protein